MTTPAKLAFSSKIRRSTLALLDEHGVNGWRVSFDYALERAGQCRYNSKEIVFSLFFLEASDEAARMNTILHEVAHVLAGPHASHGEEWAAVHRSLGGNGLSQTEMPGNLSTHDYFLWVGTCPNCGYRTGLQDAPEDVWACGACPKDIPKRERVFSWAMDGESMTPARVSEKYAEEYGLVFGG